MKNSEITTEKRKELKAISNTLKDAKKEGAIQTINEGLKQLYQAQGHTNLKTYNEWEKLGMHVKRGEKAFYVWGSQTEKTVNDEGEEKIITYFPMLALFSENQVYNSFNSK